MTGRFLSLLGVLVALALGAPGCASPPAVAAAPAVMHLTRMTSSATRLEVDRKLLTPRVVVRKPDALAWRGEHATVEVDAAKGLTVQGEGEAAFTVDADLATSPGVDYVVRAFVRGRVSLLARVENATATELSDWDEVAAPASSVPVEVTLRVLADGRKMQLRFAGTGAVSVHDLEVREAAHRDPTQVVSAEDRDLRASLRIDMGDQEYWAREGLLASGTSSYEWALTPASGPRVVELETALVARHEDPGAAAGPVAMLVETRNGGVWREAFRVERGTPADRGLWARGRAEIGDADAVRLVTRPLGDAARPTVTVAWGRPVVRPLARGNRPDVVIITIDALRADKLGAYGSKEGLSPALDQLATRAVVFDEARTSRGQTWEAMTGLAMASAPEDVGVIGRGDRVAKGSGGVAGVFADAGYLTARLGNVLLPPHQLGDMDIEEDSRKDDVAVARLEKLLEEEHERPIFAWLHLAATHYPYNHLMPAYLPVGMPEKLPYDEIMRVAAERGPPEKIREIGARADAAVRQDDALVGRLLPKLESASRAGGPALVAVAADHGSHRGEDGIWFLHSTVHRVVLRVPFFLSWAGRIQPRRVDRLVRLIDLGPTLLDYVGLPRDQLPGQSLRPLAEGRKQPSLVSVVRSTSGITVVENDRYKVIAAEPGTTLHWPESGLTIPVRELALYEWRTDPAEAHDLADEAPLVAGEMLSQLSAPRSMISRHISPDAARLLRQAGYGPAPTR